MTLDYAITGDRRQPTLILIRGIGAQRVRWSPRFLGALAEGGLCVVTFDNRDTGKSTSFAHLPTPSMKELTEALMAGRNVPVPYTLDDMALDVVGLMDSLNIERAHVMGLSMGGYIGQLLAAHHPTRVRSLICAMTSHRPPSMQAMSPEMQQLVQRGPRAQDEQSVIEYEIEQAVLGAGSEYPVDRPALEAMLRVERQRGIPEGGVTRQLIAMMASGDREALCRRIAVPALVIHGVADPIIPFQEAVELSRTLPNASLLQIEHAGHDITPGMMPLIVPPLLAFCARH